MAKRELKKKRKEKGKEAEEEGEEKETLLKEKAVQQQQPSSTSEVVVQQQTQDVSSPSPVPHVLETPPPPGLTETEVQQAVNSVLNSSQRIKATHFKHEVGVNLTQVFESFSTDTYDFTIYPDKEHLIFNRRTSWYPLDLRTIFLTSSLSEETSTSTRTSINNIKDISDNTQVYVTIQPYARAWFDTGSNLRFIQLMAFVRYGWSLKDTKNVWYEPSRVTVKVYPEVRGDSSPCSLQIDSIPHSSRRRQQPTSEKTAYDHELEMKRREYEELYQVSSPNQVTWTMQRRFSKVEKFMFDHPELTVHHSDLTSLGRQATLIIKEEEQVLRMMEPPDESFEPFAEYINFGVWRWERFRDNITFKFSAQHRMRVLSRFERSSDKYASTMVDTPVCESTFPISLRFSDSQQLQLQEQESSTSGSNDLEEEQL